MTGGGGGGGKSCLGGGVQGEINQEKMSEGQNPRWQLPWEGFHVGTINQGVNIQGESTDTRYYNLFMKKFLNGLWTIAMDLNIFD